MEGNTILSGDINSLRIYRNVVEEYDKVKEACNQAAMDEKKLERELAINQKDLKDTIDSTIKKRRSEIASTYDVEIDRTQDKIKKIKKKREKVKEGGVKERIADATSGLSSQNKDIKKDIKLALKEEKLPAFCGTHFYFMLYFTKGASEVFGCALMILIFLLALPALVWWALPWEKLGDKWQIPSFAITYFVIILFIFFIYKIIGDRTKGKHADKLNEIRALRDRVRSNDKEINRISTSITHEENEDIEGLGDLDEQIKNEEAVLLKTTSDKENALLNFDRTVSAQIKQEIETRELPRINEIEKAYKEACAKHTEFDNRAKEMGIHISSDYEAYLGKEYTNVEKIDELISIMEAGNAATVSEAVNTHKTM